MDEELIARLRETLELTEYEARVYLALVMYGALTVSEISRRSGVPRPKCYEVLRGLSSKGLVAVVSSKPVKYRTFPVKDGISNRIAQLQSELHRKIEDSERLVRDLEFLQAHKFAGREVRVMLLSDHDAIVNSSVNDASRAREEVLIAMTQSPVKFNWMHHMTHLMRPVTKGVKFKFIVPSIPKFMSKVSSISTKFRDPPFEIRACGKVKQPFSVIDGRISYIYLTDPEVGVFLTAIRIEDEAFSSQLREMFYTLWDYCELR